MMKRERENERTLKCLCLAKGYIHLLFYRRARWRERGEGKERKLTESVCEKNRKKREILTQADTYKARAEGEMHANGDTKRQRKKESRAETAKETVGRKRRD